MHELAVVESIVTAIEERVGPRRAVRLRLQVGALSGVVPDALRFCFDLCAQGTTLNGAALEIDEIPGSARCRSCGAELAIDSFLDLCRCGSADLEVQTGQELRIKEVEVN